MLAFSYFLKYSISLSDVWSLAWALQNIANKTNLMQTKIKSYQHEKTKMINCSIYKNEIAKTSASFLVAVWRMWYLVTDKKDACRLISQLLHGLKKFDFFEHTKSLVLKNHLLVIQCSCIHLIVLKQQMHNNTKNNSMWWSGS